MAEAVVDGNLLSRFFCHKCSVEIERLLPDYRCPFCTSGFIEQLEGEGGGAEDGTMGDTRSYLHGSSMDISSEDFSDFDLELLINEFEQGPNDDFDRMYLDVLEPLREMAELAPIPNGETQRTRGSQESDNRNQLQDRSRLRLLRRNQEMIQLRRPRLHVEHLVDNFMRNLTGFGLHHPTAQGGPVHPVLFLGNPGDYVWGRDGLDTIVTQLLNQMDGSGPPPLPRKQIDEIPTSSISQTQIDIKLQCSICWEDFILAELVRQLPCKHIYHTPCIEPWLELHGTCPICRQSLGDQTSAEANRDPVGPSLAALFRAANQSNNSRTPSASSSSTSTSDE